MTKKTEATTIEKLTANALETRLENIDKDTLEATKYRVIDTLGCLIGGATDTGNPELVKLLKEQGGKKETTILIYGEEVPVASAALINCIMARSFDFEPVSPLVDGFSCPGHISGTTIPAALTLAEVVDASGQDMLTALVVGNDIASRLLAASGFGFALGWDCVGTVNTFGVTAIAGRLFGLNKIQLRNAFGIVLNELGTTFQTFWDHTTAFKLPQGLAARGGISSAQLAKAGWTGPEDALMSKFGYYKMFTEGCKRPKVLTKDLGKVFYYDGTIKPYPCCRIVHSAIDCVLALIKKHGIKANDIKSVNLQVAPGGIEHAVGHHFTIGPFPHGNAAFSYEYTVATAFLFGSVKPEHFTESAIRNPQITEFIKKIKLTAVKDVEFEKARMTVTLKDGKKFTETVTKVKGDPLTNPMTNEEIIAKFWVNVNFSKRINQKKAEHLLDMLLNLEKVTGVRKLIPCLVT
jgi:2-methylcitrate dehydratase PrpD